MTAFVHTDSSEAALLSRVRRRLIPFMFLLYIAAYLDRVNVGFAALQMNRDLGLSPAFAAVRCRLAPGFHAIVAP